MSEPIALKYRAFISYSHADTEWAKWLHRGLETFPIGKDLAGRFTESGEIPKALRPVFRDRDEFTAGHALTEQTQAALDASRALIVLCSPSAAKSRYVNEEIRLFKSRHPKRPVIPLIVAGKPGDAKLECFPATLRFKLDADGQVTGEANELLAADPREEGDGKDLALAKIAAGLLGLSSDEVYRRAERERRAAARRKRRAQAAFGMLALLLAGAGIAWLNQDYLKERYYWRFVMKPEVLTADQESALKPGDQFTECAVGCPTMVVVPAGSFTMGSPPGEKGHEDNEAPQHKVMIAKPFSVSKFEVTFDDWDVCVRYGGCPRIGDWGRQPAISVSWDDVQIYVAWLSKMTGKPYRLLSEAEWEYAARGGTRTAYSWGDEIGENNANCCGSQRGNFRAAPVGSFAANPFGLHDMSGNASEWVEDCYHYNYTGAPDDGSAWVASGDCSNHVVRGGSWYDLPESLRSAYRGRNYTGIRSGFLGFRIARTLDR